MLQSNLYNMCEPNNYDDNVPVKIKVEQPEYNTLETSTSTTTSELNNMCYNEPETITGDLIQYSSDSSYKSEIYQEMMDDDSVMDYIENSIDNFLVEYRTDKIPQQEKLRKEAERQRNYRQNETQVQRERRLEMARQYTKKRRQTESNEERYERLKKQRERIRSLREAMKSNPEIYKINKQIEAERMKMRRANESPIERMKRLERSRNYSKKRRENEDYRMLENEKNRIAHQCRRSDESFRLLERQRNRERRKIKNEIFIETESSVSDIYESELAYNQESELAYKQESEVAYNQESELVGINKEPEIVVANIYEPEISICGSFTSIPVPCSNSDS